MRLKDKVAIVTGAGSGIGQSTAQLFAREGARVIVADIDGGKAAKTVSLIEQADGQATVVQADISNERDCEKIAAEAVGAFSRIDVLVNNAATFVLKGFEASVEEWHRSFGVNVVGTALCTKHVLPEMKKVGGAIVNLGSISSLIAEPDVFAYSATKAAILQITRNMAMDLAPFKIRVNCVCPGAILTPASFDHMKKIGMTLEQFNTEFGAKALLKRVGNPMEVAHAIAFLASDEASFITGTSLLVDGGYTAT